MKREKSIVVTGCSSGIGYGIAKKFVNEGFLVFGSVRTEEDGERLKSELGEKFHPLLFDVTNHGQIKLAVDEVAHKIEGKGLGGLINNAGVGHAGPLIHMPMKQIRYIFEVNVFGVLAVTRAFLPLLGVREEHRSLPGRIINISSASGQMATPFLGAYTGSKHALEGMSNVLRQELKQYGIEVVIIGPGFVKTSIAEKSTDTTAYEKTDYIEGMQKFAKFGFEQMSKEGYTVDEAGEIIYDIYNAKKPKTRYAMVRNKFKNWTLLKLMPDQMYDRVISRMFGMH